MNAALGLCILMDCWPAQSQKYGLVQDIEVDRDGMVHAPTGPGLGAQIDFELIERKKLAVLA